ncbi:hypothetical protein [Nocardia sp. NPDC002869]|uniref:hypothetical protein n=1 Tax=Nocardia sp. NPDC002869 TaxID=3161032 RepID=UPI00398D399E
MTEFNFVGLASPTLNQYKNIPALLETLEEQPGFNEAAAVYEETRSMLTELRAKRAEAEPGFDNDTILEYGEIPASWLDSIGASRVEQESLNLQIQAVESLQSRATSRLEAIAAGSGESLLATLGRKMHKVVADIRSAVDGLDGASTPLEAIERGTHESWSKLSDARKEYNRLRAAQEKVMLTSDSYAWSQAKGWYKSDRNNSFAVIRNLPDVFPLFAYATDMPWPYETDGFLVWAVRNGADLWIPTVAELATGREEYMKNFREEIDRLMRIARAHRTNAIEEINSGNVHPHVQRAVLDSGVL